MKQPLEEMARLAVQRLLIRMDNRAEGDFHLELVPELVVRRTCGASKSHVAEPLPVSGQPHRQSNNQTKRL